MYLLNEFARKKGSKDKTKRKKKPSLNTSLKKSQVFRNYVNPVANSVREVRGTVKTGLRLYGLVFIMSSEKNPLGNPNDIGYFLENPIYVKRNPQQTFLVYWRFSWQCG